MLKQNQNLLIKMNEKEMDFKKKINLHYYVSKLNILLYITLWNNNNIL